MNLKHFSLVFLYQLCNITQESDKGSTINDPKYIFPQALSTISDKKWWPFNIIIIIILTIILCITKHVTHLPQVYTSRLETSPTIQQDSG